MKGVSQNSIFNQFQIFPKLGLWSSNFQVYQIQKSPSILGEGGLRKLWGFPAFVTFFCFRWLPLVDYAKNIRVKGFAKPKWLFSLRNGSEKWLVSLCSGVEKWLVSLCNGVEKWLVSLHNAVTDTD